MVKFQQSHDSFVSEKYFVENEYDDEKTLKTNKFLKVESLNNDLSRLQKEVAYALRYRNKFKLVDLGVED